jgi:hypothetical protein
MYGKATRAILSALIALAVIAGIVVPNSAMAGSRRDQWVPEFKSQNPTKAPRVVRNLRNDDDDAGPDDGDDDEGMKELPEWADEAF